jgi:hypothetical protein
MRHAAPTVGLGQALRVQTTRRGRGAGASPLAAATPRVPLPAQHRCVMACASAASTRADALCAHRSARKASRTAKLVVVPAPGCARLVRISPPAGRCAAAMGTSAVGGVLPAREVLLPWLHLAAALGAFVTADQLLLRAAARAGASPTRAVSAPADWRPLCEAGLTSCPLSLPPPLLHSCVPAQASPFRRRCWACSPSSPRCC